MRLGKLNIILSVLVVLLLVALLVVVPNSDKNGGDVVFKQDDKSYSELAMFYDLKTSAGKELLKQVIGAKILLDNYEVSKDDFNKKKSEIIKELEQVGGFDSHLRQLGVTEKQFDNQIKVEMAHDLALKEMNKVTDKSIQKRYEEVKNSTKVIHFMSTDNEMIDKITKAMEDGKNFKDIKKLVNDGSSTIEETKFIKGQLPAELDEVFKMKLGEVKSFPTPSGTHVFKIVGNENVKFKDVKDMIERELMYKGLKSFDDIFNYLVKKHNIEFTDKYKDLLKS